LDGRFVLGLAIKSDEGNGFPKGTDPPGETSKKALNAIVQIGIRIGI
jgi:hypothetical protein